MIKPLDHFSWSSEEPLGVCVVWGVSVGGVWGVSVGGVCVVCGEKVELGGKQWHICEVAISATWIAGDHSNHSER